VLSKDLVTGSTGTSFTKIGDQNNMWHMTKFDVSAENEFKVRNKQD